MAEFTIEQIRTIPHDLIGAYLHLNTINSEIISAYVGRSTTSLRRRQQEWYTIGTQFNELILFSSENEKDAYHKECELFHSLSKDILENKIHPGSIHNHVCPWCNFSINTKEELI